MDEVQAKHGKVLHIFVDKYSLDGKVFVRFETKQGAQLAQKALHGRWFAKKTISAIYLSDSEYFSKFPELIIW